MAHLTIEKDENRLSVSLKEAVPSVVKEGEMFRLQFDAGNDQVAVLLSPSTLQMLGLQCVALMPAIAPQLSVASVEQAFRMPAQIFKELDDRSIQTLLRECQFEYVIDFLWYMKDAELMKAFMRNMSQRAAEMLMDDLNSCWRGKDPDRTLAVSAKRGRDAVEAIISIARRLIREGQIPDVFGVDQGD
ncbi:MAG TPA: FliG C-terminal domain-containing protein [Rhodocyclaceae bacterium]